MPAPRQTLPTEESASGTIARRILRNAGTSVNAPDTSSNAAEFLAFADAVADAYTDQTIATNQAFVDTATVMLSEIEESYNLTVRTDLSNAQRQSRLLAKVRAARGGTPAVAIKTIGVYDPTVTIEENLASDPFLGDPSGVFVWAAVITVAVFNDELALAAIRASIEQLKPVHTLGSPCTSVGFLCDSADSLVDRDVL